MFYNPNQQVQQNMTYPQQNLMYGGYQQSPYNYSGGIAPIGCGGFNGNYYSTNNYYNNFNPYYIKQQQEAYQAQVRESQRQEADFYKRLYKASCSYLGVEVTPEALEYYDKTLAPDAYASNNLANLSYEQQTTYEQLKIRDQNMAFHNQNLNQLAVTPVEQLSQPTITNPYYQQYAQGYQKVHEEYAKDMPDNIGLIEYLRDYAGEHYLEARKELSVQAQNASGLYNKNDFNTIMNAHKSPFNTLFNPYASIDDQEVRLPGYVSEKSRQERRARFMQSMLGGGAV